MTALEKRPSRTRLMIPAVIGALFLGITGVQQLSAQQYGAQERTACRQDVRRFCQAELERNSNDTLSITGCLQANRAKISRSCRNTLASHGQ